MVPCGVSAPGTASGPLPHKSVEPRQPGGGAPPSGCMGSGSWRCGAPTLNPQDAAPSGCRAPPPSFPRRSGVLNFVNLFVPRGATVAAPHPRPTASPQNGVTQASTFGGGASLLPLSAGGRKGGAGRGGEADHHRVVVSSVPQASYSLAS